jgi:hypothetical protein
MNIKKPGVSTARIQNSVKKVNNQPMIQASTLYGGASLSTPIKGIGGGSSFVYAPPELNSDCFIEYNDKMNRGFYIDSTIPNVSSLQEEAPSASNDDSYHGSLQDIVIQQQSSSIFVSNENGITLNTGGAIRLQFGEVLRIAQDGVSNDHILIASDTMDYLTQETAKHNGLKNTISVIIESMVTTLNAIGTTPVTGNVLAGLLTPLITTLANTNFNNPPVNMVSSKIKIPRG